MPPKGGGGPSKKSVDKMATKVVEDKTFGLKVSETARFAVAATSSSQLAGRVHRRWFRYVRCRLRHCVWFIGHSACRIRRRARRCKLSYRAWQNRSRTTWTATSTPLSPQRQSAQRIFVSRRRSKLRLRRRWVRCRSVADAPSACLL